MRFEVFDFHGVPAAARSAAHAVAIVPFLAAGLMSAAPAAARDITTAGVPAPASETAPQPSAPQHIAGMKKRYLVTDFRSLESGSGNTVTLIRVTNTSGRTCDYGVEFKRAISTSTACSVTRTNVAPMDTAIFCTRSIPDLWAACTNICNPEELGIDGTAIVYSSKSPDRCERMAVSVSIINSSSSDLTPYAARNAAIVKWAKGSARRSNKGD